MLHAVGWRTIILAAIGTLAVTSGAAAQAARGDAYVEAGAGLMWQSGPSGTVNPVSYVVAPGGTTLGWLVAGGVYVARRVSILGEVSSTGEMTAVEPSRYDTTFHEQRRDRFVTAGVRFLFPAGRSFAFEPMAGVVFTFPEASSHAVYDPGGSLRPEQAPINHDLSTAIGPAFGLDSRIGSSRVTLVPSVRFLHSAVSTGRYDDTVNSPEREIEAIYPGGYPQWTVRTSVALRLHF